MKKPDLLVLGIGSILWADEDFGMGCVDQLNPPRIPTIKNAHKLL